MSDGASTWHTLHAVHAVTAPVLLLTFDAVPSAQLLAVGDPTRTRTVLAAIAFLVAIGIGLLVLAGWLVRSTRVDPEVLAPLEAMGERSWRKADPVWQRRRLDELRPEGAEPLDPMAPPPAADAEFDLGPSLAGFDDFDDLLRQFGIQLDDAAPDEVADPLPGPTPDGGDEPVDEPTDGDRGVEVDHESGDVFDGESDDELDGESDESADGEIDEHVDDRR